MSTTPVLEAGVKRKCATSSIRPAGCGQRCTGRQGRRRIRQHRITARWSGDDARQVPHHLAASRLIVVGLPYTEQRLTNMAEISGGTPYGATTLTGVDGSRQPSENELAIARSQGRHVAQIANALVAGRSATR